MRMTTMATAVFGSAEPAAPDKFRGRAELRAYWTVAATEDPFLSKNSTLLIPTPPFGQTLPGPWQ